MSALEDLETTPHISEERWVYTKRNGRTQCLPEQDLLCARQCPLHQHSNAPFLAWWGVQAWHSTCTPFFDAGSFWIVTKEITERLQPDFRQRAMEDRVPFRVWEPCSPCASALPQPEHSGCRMQEEAAAADAFLQISPDSMLLNRRLFFPFTVSSSGQKSWRSSNMVGTKSLPFVPPVRLPKREKYKYLLCLCFMPCHPLLPEQRPQSSIQHQQNQALSLCQQCSKAFWLPR